MKHLLPSIAAQPFFKGMREQHLQLVAECAMRSHFAAGEPIFRKGDPSNRFYLIESGKVAVELEVPNGKPIPVETLGPGRELGWCWVLPPGHFAYFSKTAVEDTTLLFFYGTRLQDQCELNHDFGYELTKRMTSVMLDRIQAVSARLLELKQVCPELNSVQ